MRRKGDYKDVIVLAVFVWVSHIVWLILARKKGNCTVNTTFYFKLVICCNTHN